VSATRYAINDLNDKRWREIGLTAFKSFIA
jgi:hypothetical protein